MTKAAQWVKHHPISLAESEPAHTTRSLKPRRAMFSPSDRRYRSVSPAILPAMTSLARTPLATSSSNAAIASSRPRAGRIEPAVNSMIPLPSIPVADGIARCAGGRGASMPCGTTAIFSLAMLHLLTRKSRTKPDTAITRSARRALERATKRRATFRIPSRMELPAKGATRGSMLRTITTVGRAVCTIRAVGTKTTSGALWRRCSPSAAKPERPSVAGQNHSGTRVARR